MNRTFNKKLVFAAVLALLLVVALAFSACDLFQKKDQTKTPQSITATYSGGDILQGGTVDSTKVQVVVTYSDGSSSEVSGWSLSAVDTSSVGEKTVTVTFKQGSVSLDCTFTVKVVAPDEEPQPTLLTGISAVCNVQLDVGAQLDESDLTVTASYSDGTSKQVTGFVFDQPDTSLGGNKTFNVSYTENNVTKQCQCSCTVVRLAQSITVSYSGDIWVGETINKKDVSVIVNYNDGTNGAVTEFTLSHDTFDSDGIQTVRVTCNIDGKELVGTFQLTVKPVVLTEITATYSGGSIALNTQPDEKLLAVTAHYNNGTTKTVNASHGTVDSGTVGTKEWTISYTEDGVTVETVVEITVEEVAAPTEPTEGTYDVNVIKDEELSIHFLMLGNKSTGDSIYIKAGETDILIDAGSRYDSASAIAGYIDQYCTDGILEYVVATHCHQDHIAAFATTDSNGGGILARYECENIIKYARTSSNTVVRTNFENAVESERKQGANVFTANDCVNNTNGAQKEFTLAEGITMEILDQKYYRQSTSNENNYSVCLMIKQDDNNYLFTGDLEGEGEESLVQLNPNLPQVKLWKGGHHGSYTAGSTTLLKKIQPETVCICTCMGTTEYMKGTVTNHIFPAQEFVERVSQYTDRVYCTSDGTKYATSKECLPANGNIVFACTDGQITMYFSNNNTKLKDTDWFKNTSWFQNNPNIHQSWYN